jgi:hypothetical protein
MYKTLTLATIINIFSQNAASCLEYFFLFFITVIGLDDGYRGLIQYGELGKDQHFSRL